MLGTALGNQRKMESLQTDLMRLEATRDVGQVNGSAWHYLLSLLYPVFGAMQIKKLSLPCILIMHKGILHYHIG